MISLRTAMLIGGLCLRCSVILAQSPTAQPTSGGENKALVDSLAPAEVEAAIRMVKTNFVGANSLENQEMNRATLQGLLARLPGGVLLLGDQRAPEAPAPFFAEVLANHIGYARLGSLNAESVRELEKALTEFATRKIDSIIVDLRASVLRNDFDAAADIAKRLVPKGKTLWTLRKTGPGGSRTFSNDREPLYRGTMMVLIDGETSGPAEPLAASLRLDSRALLIGQPTAGRAAEYSDFPLQSGKLLRIATAEVLGPDGQPLFPAGVKADVSVELPAAQKREIFGLSAQRGMSSFVFEAERPHFNEAALIAGTNPELEARQQKRQSDDNLHDAVVQRAVDVITSLAVLQQH